MKNSIRLIGLIGLIGLVSYLFPISSFAQSKSSITVSPQLIQLDLNHAPPEAEYTYTNNTTQTIELTLSMQDVKELEDRGVPGLLNPKESRNYKYGLSSWVTFSNRNLVISPGESKTVKIFVDADRLSIGGHYASILAEIQQLTDNKKVKLRAILSSLLFVRAGSNFNESADILELKLHQNLFSFPQETEFKLKNTGNIDLTPHGTILIQTVKGKVVGKAIVNEDSLITLPESTRLYTQNVQKLHDFVLPGVYKAVIQIHYGNHKIEATKELTFFTLGSIDPKLVGVAVTILLVIVILLREILVRRK